MQFELATVVSCEPGGCQVMPLSGGDVIEARFSALVLDKVRILPGQLVALDMQPDTPEIAWRWYRTLSVEPGDQTVIVQERERQLSAARVPGLETPANAGDELWVTGMAGVWELHDRVVDGKPSDPARLREQVLPRIARLLESSPTA